MTDRKKHCLGGMILACLLFVWPLSFSFGEEKVTLNADEVVYDEAGYFAVARGNVKLRYQGVRIFADSMEVDTVANVLSAYGAPQKPVTMMWKNQKVQGRRVEYNFLTREGTIYDASGRRGELRFSGALLKVVPRSKKTEEKPHPSEKKASQEEKESPLGTWEDVTITTCSGPEPHYRLMVKRLEVTPGKKIVAHKPRVYIGKHLLFQYPFDYVVRLGPKRTKQLQANVFPSLAYRSSKGVGVGVRGPVTWDRGDLDVGIMCWDKKGMEGTATLTQEISPGLSLFAISEYTYDEITDDTNWRAQWGLRYRKNGWKSSLLWSQREFVEIEKKTGETYRGILWRDPELYLYSSWFKDAPSGSWYRLVGTAGRYEENAGRIRREGVGLELYGQGNRCNAFVPFWKALYMYYNYHGEDVLEEVTENQRVTEVALGATWSLGILQMRTSCVRRWVSGESPMGWDAMEEREDFYQKVTLPLEKGWSVALRGGYDNLEKELREMVYWVTYGTDCMKWQLVYRDDLGDEDDNWAGLRISILAFPETPFGIGQEEVEVPGKAPEDLPQNAFP